MIAQLIGKLVSKSPTVSVIDCGGVGYEVFHTPFTAEQLSGDVVRLMIHMVVREDAMQLFGFAQSDERNVFRELLRVNNVGPKLALSILSGIAHGELIHALQTKDASRLQKIPGIGKKTADRLVVELADRLGKMQVEGMISASGTLQIGNAGETDLESVLLNLGYQRVEITKAIRALKAKGVELDELGLESMVKTTLREMTQVKPV